MLRFNHFIYILLSRILLYSLITVPEQKKNNSVDINRRISAPNENRQRTVLA